MRGCCPATKRSFPREIEEPLREGGVFGRGASEATCTLPYHLQGFPVWMCLCGSRCARSCAFYKNAPCVRVHQIDVHQYVRQLDSQNEGHARTTTFNLVDRRGTWAGAVGILSALILRILVLRVARRHRCPSRERGQTNT